MTLYASQKNVQVLVALLKAYGIRHAVISPGSRNMPLVISMENDPWFTCYSVVDERSAAYFAIGVSLANRSPVILSCTSAQATRNYIPAMTEAFYRGTPLVVITADYKPSLIGQGTMQAIDQMSIPVDTRKVSVRLPMVRDDDDEKYCARLVNEALLGLSHQGTGPVHIDMPVEEHWDGGVPALPPVKKIDRYLYGEEFPEIKGRVLVTVGQHAPFTAAEAEALDAFAERYDAVVYTNHLSNYHGPRAVNASLLVENMDRRTFEDYAPDVLITIGGQIGDYGIDDRLKGTQRFKHWRVHPDGAIRDTYGRLTKIFQCTEVEFFNSFRGGSSSRGRSYFSLWEKANARRAIPAELPLSHAFVAATLSPRVPAGSIMHFAILSSLRNWNFFEVDHSVECYSNVAAFGIDGCLSTFIGHSVATERLAFLVIGDLSFFYDMSSIGIRHVGRNARIVLVNNNGGGEFRLYSHAANQFGENADVHIAAAGHHGAAQAWVESMGWEYVAVRTKDDLEGCADRFVDESDRPILIEVFTTMQHDSDGVRVIRGANTVESLERRIAKHLPPEVKRVAKRLLRR